MFLRSRLLLPLLLCVGCAACRTWRVGEAAPAIEESVIADPNWNVAVNELMSMPHRVAGVDSVQSYGDSVRITLSSNDAVTRAARVLAASGNAVIIRVYAPIPPATALLVTSGGFPAERIATLQSANRVSLLAALVPKHAAPPSHPQ